MAGGKAPGWEMFLIERNLRGVPAHGGGASAGEECRRGTGNWARVQHGVDTFWAVRQVDVSERTVSAKLFLKPHLEQLASFHLFASVSA